MLYSKLLIEKQDKQKQETEMKKKLNWIWGRSGRIELIIIHKEDSRTIGLISPI